MKCLKYLPVLAVLSLLLTLAVCVKPPPRNLQIGVKYKPENCDPVAQNGVKLAIHCEDVCLLLCPGLPAHFPSPR